MLELIRKIEQWAEDRNIIKGSKPIDQTMKLFSEFGELADNVGKGRDCRDDVGDVFVVLTIMCKQLGKSISEFDLEKYELYSDKRAVLSLSESLFKFSDYANTGKLDDEIYSCVGHLDYIAEYHETTLEECVQITYNDIKDRKGIMNNGIFIKESDPVYAQVIAEIEGNYDVK